MANNDNNEGRSGGIQSLDAALRLLLTMAAHRSSVSLSELARECHMPPSKVHRYLASFQHAGLVAQAGRSGKYDLGAGAAALGLSALARHDFVNTASDALLDFCVETDLTVLLSVWGTHGATIIRWERASAPTVTSMGLGTTMPLLNSATGRAFLAWAPPAPLQTILKTELRNAHRNPAITQDLQPTERGIEAFIQAIRARGYASVDGKFIPGLVAIAAPILDWQGQAQAVVTLVGTNPSIPEPGSVPVKQLIAFCKRLSFPPMTEKDIARVQ